MANTKTMYRYFSTCSLLPTYNVIGAGVIHGSHTICMRMDPTHQSDRRCGLSLFGLGTPTPLCKSRITAYLQPVQVLCLTIKQVDQMGFLRWPRLALVNFFPPHAQSGWPSYLDMCSCSMATSTNHLFHRPTSRAGTHGPLCSTFVLFRMPNRASNVSFFLLLCARAPVSRSSRLQNTRYIKCLTTQHGSRSARTAETQHLTGIALPAGLMLSENAGPRAPTRVLPCAGGLHATPRRRPCHRSGASRSFRIR